MTIMSLQSMVFKNKICFGAVCAYNNHEMKHKAIQLFTCAVWPLLGHGSTALTSQTWLHRATGQGIAAWATWEVDIMRPCHVITSFSCIFSDTNASQNIKDMD